MAATKSKQDRRGRSFQLRMKDSEFAKLQELADASGVTASDIVRLLVSERHALQFGARTRAK